MRYSVASTIALAAAVVASPVAQGVTEEIKPDSSAPSGCSPDHSGEFQIQVTNVTSSATKRDISKVRSIDCYSVTSIANNQKTEAASRRQQA